MKDLTVTACGTFLNLHESVNIFIQLSNGEIVPFCVARSLLKNNGLLAHEVRSCAQKVINSINGDKLYNFSTIPEHENFDNLVYKDVNYLDVQKIVSGYQKNSALTKP